MTLLTGACSDVFEQILFKDVTFFMTRQLQRTTLFQKKVAIASILILVLSTLAGAAQPVYCLERQELHILENELFLLGGCHDTATGRETCHSLQDLPGASHDSGPAPCDTVTLSAFDSLFSQQLKKSLPDRTFGTFEFSRPPAAENLTGQVIPASVFQRDVPSFRLACLESIVLLI